MPTAQWVRACISGSLGDEGPATFSREMTIEGYCHAGLEIPGRDIAIASNCLFQLESCRSGNDPIADARESCIFS